MPTKDGRALDSAVDEIDAGWEDDSEDEAEDSDDADLDAGWDAADAAKSPEEREREWRGLTPEERAARTARAAERKEKLRAKAAAKAERRRERASIAKAKQKQKVQRARKEQAVQPRGRQAEPRVAGEPETSDEPARRPREPRNDPRVLAFLVAVVLLAAGIALFLWKR